MSCYGENYPSKFFNISQLDFLGIALQIGKPLFKYPLDLDFRDTEAIPVCSD